MSDIVQRLRDSATQARALDRAALLNEAAGEIERLRLTDGEREAVAWFSRGPSTMLALGWEARATTLRGLLERMK